MYKNLIVPLLAISILYFSCSKSSQPGPKNNTGSSSVKIEIVSGNSQTDTVGYPLLKPINIKVTSTSGSPLTGYGVLYQGSGCSVDNPISVNLAADGTSAYYWYLAGDVGQQSLKIVVLDAQNKHVDSTTAVSNAIAPAVGGWHLSACTYPFGAVVTAFCKLSTGRMFTVLAGGLAYLRYSDDNGASWNSVKSLGNTHRLLTIVSTPADELFVATSDGNFFSNDAGQTWTSLGVQGFDTGPMVSGIAYTPSGKLFVTTQYNSLYISSDKGKTWLIVPPTAFVIPNSTGHPSNFNSPTEDQAGNLYVLSYETGTIFKSADGGKTWTYLNFPNIRFTNLFIDKNNWFYTSVNGQPAYGVYVSKDDGATFTLLSSSTTGFNQEISVQSDGNLYYTMYGSGLSVNSTGLYRLNNAIAPAKWIWGNIALGFAPYIVTKNNNVVEADGLAGFMRYTNK